MTGNDIFAHPRHCAKPYSVSEINRGIASIIEAGNTLVWVEGELSNFKCASSGHCYGTLKDGTSQIPVVIWRSNALKLPFEPEDGMAVMVIAMIRVYLRGGYYQLDIQRMQPAGRGALYVKFEKLKKKLEGEGLFDAARKRPLPERIKTLGVITAKTGAAIHDICRVVLARSPQTDILLRSAPVQGDGAAAAIAAAIQEMNEYGIADCIIVGRGGGSIEDLWAFNEEILARAIFASSIPIISAVGHEVDFTIADFVADMRAPTPSAAAEIAVCDEKENRRYFDGLADRFSAAFQRAFALKRSSFQLLATRPGLRRPPRALADGRQRHDELRERIVRSMASALTQKKIRVAHAGHRLNGVSPLSVLARGYSVVQDTSGAVIRDASRLHTDDKVMLRLHKGSAHARISKIDLNHT